MEEKIVQQKPDDDFTLWREVIFAYLVVAVISLVWGISRGNYLIAYAAGYVISLVRVLVSKEPQKKVFRMAFSRLMMACVFGGVFAIPLIIAVGILGNLLDVDLLGASLGAVVDLANRP